MEKYEKSNKPRGKISSKSRMSIKGKKQNSGVQKEPISLYLPSDLVEKVEHIHLNIIQKLPRNKRKKLNKSQLYEIILRNIVDDHIKKEQDGMLWKMVTDWSQS
ncbi:MAG: hypothetical protein WA584_11465 [Pyrinomonadaceae bacterium]